MPKVGIAETSTGYIVSWIEEGKRRVHIVNLPQAVANALVTYILQKEEQDNA